MLVSLSEDRIHNSNWAKRTLPTECVSFRRELALFEDDIAQCLRVISFKYPQAVYTQEDLHDKSTN
jgi:hypothetical protein